MTCSSQVRSAGLNGLWRTRVGLVSNVNQTEVTKGADAVPIARIQVAIPRARRGQNVPPRRGWRLTRQGVTRGLVVLEVLHRSVVLLGFTAGGEGAEVAALAGFWIDLAGVEPIFAGFELPNHGCCSPTIC